MSIGHTNAATFILKSTGRIAANARGKSARTPKASSKNTFSAAQESASLRQLSLTIAQRRADSFVVVVNRQRERQTRTPSADGQTKNVSFPPRPNAFHRNRKVVFRLFLCYHNEPRPRTDFELLRACDNRPPVWSLESNSGSTTLPAQTECPHTRSRISLLVKKRSPGALGREPPVWRENS